MTAHDGPGTDEEGTMHDAVGAYALGVLDDADATAFEEHLAGCELCAARLDEFSGMEPLLALLADGPGARSAPEAPDGRAPGRGPPPRGRAPPPPGAPRQPPSRVTTPSTPGSTPP
ncbi:anti-sigma factor family protein, partial [Streptomyces sp. 8L]|uniref:anti-sigma factor family protein n=1 Tax=Streptomyces sp. 8L TaxID=2877242 RepID=UPI001CD58AF5